MAHPSLVNVGAYIHAGTLALPPASKANGATTNSSALPIGDFRSGVLVVFAGAATGSPTAVAVEYTLQSRVNSDGAWADVTNPDGEAYTVTLSAANSIAELDINFMHMEDEHTELRVVEDVTLTAGSSPTLLTGAVLVRGGSNRRPV